VNAPLGSLFEGRYEGTLTDDARVVSEQSPATTQHGGQPVSPKPRFGKSQPLHDAQLEGLAEEYHRNAAQGMPGSDYNSGLADV
jgi:hypothetical protein